ncbi:MAG TPA: Y-family DNA polymerase [Pyrinomonadaceae bacterium]
MFAVVDCDNFYVECERVFAPALRRRPVVVLSNNDGCVISRSAEAKALGIGMGAPLFQVRDVVSEQGVRVFSSNYALYGDMSGRVMQTLASLSPEVEVYSIDEAFVRFDAAGRKGKPLDHAHAVRERIRRWTGVPVSIGLGPTKTLAKVAVRLAKRSGAESVYSLDGGAATEEALANLAVGEVWGIGRKRARVLHDAGIETALGLSRADGRWLRRRLSIVTLRTAYELRGVSCLPLECCPRPKRSITTSRSFGRPVETLPEIQEALAYFVTKAAEKLRRARLAARVLHVFLMTNRFEPETFYAGAATVPLSVPTDLTPELIGHARGAAARAFREGCQYRKAGVMLLDLVDARPAQAGLFDDRDRERARRVVRAVDEINARLGEGAVRFGAAGGAGRPWRTRCESRSPRYTTCWRELLTLNT